MSPDLGRNGNFEYFCGMKWKLRRLAAVLAVGAAVAGAETCPAQECVEYSATAYGGGATGTFNPYMLGSWRYGRTPMNGEALIDVAAEKPFDLSRRFSWTAGAEAVAGWSGKADYERYNSAGKNWLTQRRGMPAVWIQQLYAGIKFRGVFLTAGMRQEESLLVDGTLSSGDLLHSNNARPIAQLRAGFIDFQNIPFTRGWVQIEGVLAYGKMADADYIRSHYNYWNNHITLGSLYNYKRIYFRSNPSKPLTVTIGMQAAALFGGTTHFYYKGVESKTVKNKQSLKAFLQMIIPHHDPTEYYDGSHLGSWDFRADYRLHGGHTLSAYFQWLWEDGSSMGRRNKWDGLWGLQYRRNDGRRHILESAVVEYIDFTDQSGPLHWAPGDSPGTDITTHATGGDNYYNNSGQNAYEHLGMALGTPFIVSPIYNTNGFPQFIHTRSNGFHAAARGSVSSTVDWRAAVSYAQARGSGRWMTNESLHNTSAMLEGSWRADAILPGLSASLAVAFDAGRLRGDNFGALATVRYAGSFTFANKKK